MLAHAVLCVYRVLSDDLSAEDGDGGDDDGHAEEEEPEFSQLADEMDEILNDPPPQERVREKAPSREAAFDFAPPRREERVEEDRPRDRDDDEVRRSGDGAPGKPPPPARSPEERRASQKRARALTSRRAA